MLTKLTAGMNFSTKNQTRGSSLHRAVDTVWQRLKEEGCYREAAAQAGGTRKRS
jgi:hypothetical protein